MTDTGIVKIHGKEYHTVAKRVQDFRAEYKAYTLSTEVAFRDGSLVAMKATIADDTGRVIATGHAEEDRTKGQINKSSALENAETSAIGRALAAFGIGGTEFASANEVQNAVHQQSEPERKKNAPVSQDQLTELMDHMEARGIAPAALISVANENLGTSISQVSDLPNTAFADALSWVKSQQKAA